MGIEFDIDKTDNRRALDGLLERYDPDNSMPAADVVAGAMVARAVIDLADAIREAAQEKRVH